MNFRTYLAAAAGVVLLGGLAACGGDDDSDTASSGTSGTTNNSSGTIGGASTPDAGDAPGPSDSTAMIMMKDNSFSPAKLTVAPRTEIMIMNQGQAVHDLKDKDSNGKAFDSGDVAAGEKGSITAPGDTGDYPYKCTYHFGMEGTLTVK